MNTAKKIMCILLAVVMLTMQITAAAAMYNADNAPQTITDIPENPEEIVGTISLYGRVRSLLNTGHTWIYIENTSDEDITVALKTIAPGEGVSFGTFAISRYDGVGLYYNIETHCGNKYGTAGCSSITESLTAAELEYVSNRLLNSNSFSPLNNCTMFTISLWNSVAQKKVIPIPIPWLAYLFISLSGEPNRPMYYATADEVYKQIGNGEEAYLVPVSEKSLERPI